MVTEEIIILEPIEDCISYKGLNFVHILEHVK